MIKKIGVIANDFGISQLNYNFIHNSNKILSDMSPAIDIIGFYENTSMPCVQPNFAIMHIMEGWSFDGIMIATNLATANQLIRFPGPSKKYFYVWDLEWLRYTNFYNVYSNIYRNKSLKLLCRSNEHKDIIEKCWNVNVHSVIEDCDMEKVVNL